MPKKHSIDLLFHKKVKKEPIASASPAPSTPSSAPRKSATPRPPVEPEVDDELKLPSGNYQEFKLMSSALNGWKYDVMKFDSRKSVDIGTWEQPIKLNRKDARRDEGAPKEQVPVGPMLGADGKPVMGPDGKIVMVDSHGRPIHNTNNNGEGSSKDKGNGKVNGKKKFQKKTRQVFLVPETTRQLRREERYPWVIEDASHKEVWVGQLEEVSKAETHALFMPAANEVFKFVPANRWYKFQKKPSYHIPSLEEAESIMAKMAKNKDPQHWLMHNRSGVAPSSATLAMFKTESAEGLRRDGSGSGSGPGRRLRTVVRSESLFDDDDEDGEGRRRKKENDGEGDIDEMAYEEEFADDEEQMEAVDQDDEEAKELEERLKREYKNANKQREGYIDESDEEEEPDHLTKDGKAMKKLIRNLEKNTAYESDEERNPYASSEEEEEEEEEEPVATEGPAIQPQPQQINSRQGSQAPSPNPASTTRTGEGSAPGSRATSPSPSNSAPAGLGGHSVVAKRATSPKLPKLKTSASHGSSPLSNGLSSSSRASSPGASRPTHPGPPGANGALTSTPRSPTIPGAAVPLLPSNKRKATDDLAGAPSAGGASGVTAPKLKKRKPMPVGPPPEGELTDAMLVEWLKMTPNATTRDCIQHFQPYLRDESKKNKFTSLVKEVAQLKEGVLVLKPAYRDPSAAPSPTPTTPAPAS